MNLNLDEYGYYAKSTQTFKLFSISAFSIIQQQSKCKPVEGIYKLLTYVLAFLSTMYQEYLGTPL